jgi:hypothetical protein
MSLVGYCAIACLVARCLPFSLAAQCPSNGTRRHKRCDTVGPRRSMSIEGSGRTRAHRLGPQNWIAYNRQLSERHLKWWGDECPATDMDFLLNEYNYGIPVAIVDYKHHLANLGNTNSASYKAVSHLYNEQHEQIPFFIARYWPENWAFKLFAVNDSACNWWITYQPHFARVQWRPLTEQQYVKALYRLRKDALNAGDERYITRLNDTLPPDESQESQAAS